MGFMPSLIILGTLAFVAWRLASMRPLAPELAEARRSAAVMLLITTLVQLVHFTEEAMTGFHAAFPAIFGQPAIPFAVFMAFNLVWLVLWLVSVPGVNAGHRFALFAAWFLAIAGMLNGVAHPLLAAATRGYFPGLVTSPFIGIAGLLLGQRLRRASAPRVSARAA